MYRRVSFRVGTLHNRTHNNWVSRWPVHFSALSLVTIPYSSEKSGENSQSRLDASSVHSLLEAETAYFIPFHFFFSATDWGTF